MDDSQNSKTPESVQPVGAMVSGIARRRLLRAGLAAAPVVAALKSNTVLAGSGGCVRPSAFASLDNANWNVSQDRVFEKGYACSSPEAWKSNQASWPENFRNALFLSEQTRFVANPGGKYASLTLQQVLEMNSQSNDAKLARFCVAALLSTVSVNNDPFRALLTLNQCAEIWNGQGNWSPFAGKQWTMSETLHYFETVYAKTQLL